MPEPVQQSLPLFPDDTPSRFEPYAGLTEIILSRPTSAGSDHHRILPMLSELSRAQSDRWFTWITQSSVSKDLLKQYGFELARMRILHAKNMQDTLWLFWEALNSGTSATVVTECEPLTEDAFSKLEAAALNGAAQGLLIRQRQS